MELVIIARFHAREGEETVMRAALAEQIAYVRKHEPDCPFIDAYSSKRNTRLFWIYSRWRDEAAFDIHAELPNTLSFIRKMEKLIDHPFDATRALSITWSGMRLGCVLIKSVAASRPPDVCFSPNSGAGADIAALRLRANNGLAAFVIARNTTLIE